jgi:hypothetical protein
MVMEVCMVDNLNWKREDRGEDVVLYALGFKKWRVGAGGFAAPPLVIQRPASKATENHTEVIIIVQRWNRLNFEFFAGSFS